MNNLDKIYEQAYEILFKTVVILGLGTAVLILIGLSLMFVKVAFM